MTVTCVVPFVRYMMNQYLFGAVNACLTSSSIAGSFIRDELWCLQRRRTPFLKCILTKARIPGGGVSLTSVVKDSCSHATMSTCQETTPPLSLMTPNSCDDQGTDRGLQRHCQRDTVAKTDSYPQESQWQQPSSVARRGKYIQAPRTRTAASPPLIPRPHIRRVVLLEKLTRWEVLCNQATDSAEVAQMKLLFPGMFETYIAHTVAINHVLHLLKDVHGLRVDHLKAQTKRTADISNVDAIIAAGGDGTFLEAASLVGPSTSWRPLRDSNEASSVNEKNRKPIWVFGINTDPSRSEGNLLMKPDASAVSKKLRRKSSSCTRHRSVDIPAFPSQGRQNSQPQFRRSGTSLEFLDESNTTAPKTLHLDSGHIGETLEGLRQVIDRIVHGDYTPLRRRRIRITIVSPEVPLADGPIGTLRLPGTLDRAASSTPRRQFDSSPSVKRPATLDGLCRPRSTPMKTTASPETAGPSSMNDNPKPHLVCPKTHSSSKATNDMAIALSDGELPQGSRKSNCGLEHSTTTRSSKRQLDYLAVNDVLITSEQSHMSFYVELSVDGSKPQRSKNSGVIICTGSGSSAWAYNVSKVSEDTVETVIEQFIARQPLEVQKALVPVDLSEIRSAANSLLLFSPSEPRMRLVVREPIDNRVFATTQPSTFGRKISLRPLTQDAVLCLDGISIVPVRFGQTVVLEIDFTEDAILTAV